MFWLKKTVSFWLMPLPFCLALLAIGLWLLWRNRRPRLGRAILTFAALLLILFSNRAVSYWLANPLERVYPPIAEFTPENLPTGDLQACRYIMVLGGGHANSPQLSPLAQLSDSALSRITEGVRLARVLPQATLIVSGPAMDDHSPTHASILARAAVELGIDPKRIVKVDTARDTEDESMAAAALVHGQPMILVTSAWHMPRAAALFRKHGLVFIPAPTDYRSKPTVDFILGDYGWDSESLTRSTLAVRERLGLLWARLTGKISSG